MSGLTRRALLSSTAAFLAPAAALADMSVPGAPSLVRRSLGFFPPGGGGGGSTPVNSVAPVASGTPQVGQTLSVTNGTWTNSPTAYAYQWLGNGAVISGATSATYVLQTSDIGTMVSCAVTAFNASGSGSSVSNALGPVTAAPTGSTWSTADASANAMTLSNGGLTVTPSGSSANWQSIRGSIGKSSGKLYFEVSASSAVISAPGSIGIGLGSASCSITAYLGNSNYSFSLLNELVRLSLGAGATNPYSPAILPAASDVWAIAVDLTAGNIWIAQNNVWAGSGNPGAGANPMVTYLPAQVGASLFPGMSFYSTGCGVWTLQPTPASQKYLPPPGFQAWDGGPVTPTGSTWSTADAAALSATLSNGNSTVVMTQSSWQIIRGSASHSSGKYYVEFFTPNGSGGAEVGFGIADATTAATLGYWLGSHANQAGVFNVSDGNVCTPIAGANGFNFAGTTISSTPAVANDVWAIAADFTAGKFWIAKNNVWFGSGNPGGGTNSWATFGSAVLGLAYFPAISATVATAGTWTLQPTAASQTYAPPSGFTAWG